MKKVWMFGSMAVVAGGLMLSTGCGTTHPAAPESTVPVAPVVMPPTTPEVAVPKVEEVKPPVAEVATKTYVVKSGDSISLIAKRFKVSSRDIMKMNNITNANKIRVGQKLTLPGSVDLNAAAPAVKASVHKKGTKAAAKATAGSGSYVVKSGDTLGHIAAANKTTIRALKQVNNLSSDKLHVGQKLVLPKGSAAAAPAGEKTEKVEAPAAEAAPAPEAAPAAEGVTAPAAAPASPNEVLHVVEPNQDLGSIAMMYGVRAEEVMKLNNLSSPDVKVGQTLKIPPPAE